MQVREGIEFSTLGENMNSSTGNDSTASALNQNKILASITEHDHEGCGICNHPRNIARVAKDRLCTFFFGDKLWFRVGI